MTPKVLSKSGESLADIYDVEGSIAGVEELLSREVSLIHEMGAEIFSERVGGQIRRLTTGDIAASIAFDLNDTTLPVNVAVRILGVTVLVDTGGRIDHVQVSVRNNNTGREVPIFAWDVSDDVEKNIRIVENGGVAGEMELLMQDEPLQIPNILIGSTAAGPPELVVRGVAAAFGAGTVECVVLTYVAFAELGGVSSKGLPIPSW